MKRFVAAHTHFSEPPDRTDARIPGLVFHCQGNCRLAELHFLGAGSPVDLVFERESSWSGWRGACLINGLSLRFVVGATYSPTTFRTVMSSNFDINLSIYETAMTVIVVIRQLIGWLMAALTALQLWHIYFNTVWLMPLTGRLSERLADIIDRR